MYIRLLILIYLIGPSLVFGQAKGNIYFADRGEPKTFTGAFCLGFNFSQVDGDSYYGYHKVGLHVGGQVFAHLTSDFGVSMELLYSRKGSRAVTVTESLMWGTYVWKYYMDVNYVEVPIMIHATTGRKWDLEAGASYGVLVNSNEYVVSDQPVAITPERNSFNRSDIDMVFGARRKLRNRLLGSVRYQYSLTSIRPTERIPVGYSYGNQGQFNNLFTLRFEYLF